MTMAAVAIGAAAVAATATAVSSSVAAGQQADAAADAAATMQGGINRSEQFRLQLESDQKKYRQWQADVTGPLVREVTSPAGESQAYRDASLLLGRSLAGSGNIRSGAAVQGFRDLAMAESDNQYRKQMALAGLLGQQNAQANNVSANVLASENALVSGKGDAQMAEGAARAGGTMAIGDSVSSFASTVGGVAGGGFGGGLGGEILGAKGPVFGGAGSTAVQGDGFDQTAFAQSLSVARR